MVPFRLPETLTIEKLVYGGEGLSRLDGKVVLTAKVRAEVLVGNSAMLFALLLVLIALFFVSSFFFVPVLILG